MTAEPTTPAWIETTFYVVEAITRWRVVCGGEVLMKGEVEDDRSGIGAFEVAHRWLSDHQHGAGGWKHAVDRTLDGVAPTAATAVESLPASTVSAPAPAPTEAWIETTYLSSQHVSEWRIVVGGDVKGKGTVAGDRAGARAFETACRRMAELGVPLGGWTHAIDRDRCTDAPAAQHYGWAECATGGREPITLTEPQRDALTRRLLPCPVCGEPCGPALRAADEVKRIALAWNGARWHAMADVTGSRARAR